MYHRQSNGAGQTKEAFALAWREMKVSDDGGKGILGQETVWAKAWR